MQGLGKAVDISRINGMRMSTHYPADPAVRQITDALQLALKIGKEEERISARYLKESMEKIIRSLATPITYIFQWIER